MNPKKRYKLAEDLKNFRTGEMVCKVKKSSQTDVRVDYFFFLVLFQSMISLISCQARSTHKVKTEDRFQYSVIYLIHYISDIKYYDEFVYLQACIQLNYVLFLIEEFSGYQYLIRSTVLAVCRYSVSTVCLHSVK